MRYQLNEGDKIRVGWDNNEVLECVVTGSIDEAGFFCVKTDFGMYSLINTRYVVMITVLEER